MLKRRYDTSNRPRRSGKASGARGDYDSARFKRERREFLAAHPICACGCGERATTVDHIEPVRPSGDPRFFDQSNWQPMAWRCHLSKSRREQAERCEKPKVRGGRVRIDPKTGLPLPGQAHHWWSNTE